MTKTEVKKFISTIIPTVLELGEVIIGAQDSIVDLGKNAQKEEGESQRRFRVRNAKTKMDDHVQEALLKKIKEDTGTDSVRIDAEEDTTTKAEFTQNTSTVIVIDPIDGTLEYTQGSDQYSINIGVIENGDVLSTLIYFPKMKKMYLLDEEKKAFIITFDRNLQEKNKVGVKHPTNSTNNTIYINDRVPKKSKDKLLENGFSLIEDDGNVLWPEALIRCIKGEYDCCVMYDAQVRDVLLGAFIQNLPHGYLVDWKGKEIPWPNGGRFRTGIFSREKVDPKIIQSLQI